jgi:hypothetical protein
MLIKKKSSVLSTEEIDACKFRYNINHFMTDEYTIAPSSSRFLEIDKWLEANVEDYVFGSVVCEGIYIYWALGVEREEDYVAFALRFQKLR